MNELFTILFFIAIFFTAKSSSANEFVSGYCRSDGTCVNGYWRSSPDPTVQDNFSYHGNINPYTGQVGTNYYRNNPTSEYYGTKYENINFSQTISPNGNQIYSGNSPTITSDQPMGWQAASQNLSGAINNVGNYLLQEQAKKQYLETAAYNGCVNYLMNNGIDIYKSQMVCYQKTKEYYGN